MLYVVATPIGNLEDISPRAVSILQNCDLIACEDTRVSQNLLNALGIKKPLLSLHKFNEKTALNQVIKALEDYKKVALISDAGTPLISDPGFLLTAEAHRLNFKISPITGACALIAALSVSGFTADKFYFAGFIPSKDGERRKFLEPFNNFADTAIFYETPHRIRDTAATMTELFNPNREIVVARELTKVFEEIKRLKIAELTAWLDSDPNHQKGEFVLVLEADNSKTEPVAWQQLALDLKNLGLSSKDISQVLAKNLGANKKEIYNFLVSSSNEQ